MDAASIKEIVEIVGSITTVIATIVGGLWIYLRFVREGEGLAKLQCSSDIRFVDVVGQSWIAEVRLSIENKGKVRFWLTRLIGNLYLFSGETLVQPPSAKSFCSQCTSNLTSSFMDWSGTYIEPGTVQLYHAYFVVPADAKVVCCISSIYALQEETIEGEHIGTDQEFDVCESLAKVPSPASSAPARA